MLKSIRKTNTGIVSAPLNAATAAIKWVSSGFKVLPNDKVAEREKACLKCVEWVPDARFGLGKCKQCKCTSIKWHLPLEQCPLGKWPAIGEPPAPKEKIDDTKFWEGKDADKILHWYRGHTPLARRPLPDLAGYGCTTNVLGLGDTIILTDLAAQDVPVFSRSPHFPKLMRLNQRYNQWHFDHRKCIDNSRLIYNFDVGAGHYIQRLQRAFKLPVATLPMGSICYHSPKVKNRVVMHWEAGKHQEWQLRNIHPQARILYAQNRLIIEQFVKDHPDWEFIEVGSVASIRGAEHRLNLPLEETIAIMASAEYFLGIISGPMHLATALNCRCVAVINFPRPERIFLPTLKCLGQVEEEWLYPQNVHLHQDGAGPLVPQFGLETLEKAFNGEIYPYWSDEFLPLIHEKL